MFRLCVSALLLLLATRAAAQQTEPVQTLPAPPALAGDQPLPLSPGEGLSSPLRETTDRGIRLFLEGDYDGAIVALRAAYELSPKPMFLFNIAQAHRKAGRPKEALVHYQLFLQKAPETPLRAETEAYIELVRTQLRMQTPPPLPLPLPLPMIIPPPVITDVSKVPAPRVREPVRRVPLYRRPGLWAGVGLTVAAITGVAIGVYLGTRPPATTLGILEPTF